MNSFSGVHRMCRGEFDQYRVNKHIVVGSQAESPGGRLS